MYEKSKKLITKLHPKAVTDTFPTFLKDESISGKLILVAALLALGLANSPLRHSFEAIWHANMSIGLADYSLSLDLRHWINEGLMAIFFLVVGLEIKRELEFGELRNIKNALLPIGAALGGMVVPAIIYVALNVRSPVIQGWGIPIATDIAFAVGILTLLGSRVPKTLKLFLMTLAIADDIGAIFIIALFYAEIINYWYLGLSLLLVTGCWLFRKQLSAKAWPFLLLGVVLWLTTHLSGIHASIVGAALGLIAPVKRKDGLEALGYKLEEFFLPISTFIVLPVFALANAGVVLSANAFGDTLTKSVLMGVVLGLLFGKAIGITAATWLLVKVAKLSLPKGVAWKQIIGIGFIAGIGFTVSIFITELAFKPDHRLMDAAKIGIFIASILSAFIGAVLLRLGGRSSSSA